MPCRFILGKAGSGKTHYCIAQIAAMASADGLGTQAVFLLPEQATFIHERALALACPGKGFFHADVTSFNRLMWKAGISTELPALSESGKLLLMTKILAAKRDELHLLGRDHLGSGFVRTLVSAAEEMLAYQITPEQLAEAASSAEARDKLLDLALIYGEYLANLRHKYSVNAEQLQLLAQAIMERGFLNDAVVYIDGYSDFSPAEEQVIAAMMQRCERVEIALSLDPKQADQTITEDNIFRPLWHTYFRLTEVARKSGTKILPPCVLDGAKGRFVQNQELAAVERVFSKLHSTEIFDKEPKTIRAYSAEDKRSELVGIAREIRRLVRDQGLQYHEIGVITRDSDEYEDILAEVFGAARIPYFIDSRKKMVFHPLIELVRSALELWAERLRHRYVFRYLKNQLSPISYEEANELENYCLANGVDFYHWQMKEDWYMRRNLDPEKLSVINELRRRAVQELLNFIETLGDRCSGEQLVTALRGLLADLQVEERLASWAKQARQDKLAAQAAINEQVNQTLSQLLVELETLFAKEELSARRWFDLLDKVLGSLNLAIIPPGLDEVFISSLDRSRNPELKAAFVVGINDGKLPKKIVLDSIFSDRDREELQGLGIRLADPASLRQVNENYLVYVALTRSGERLYLSYIRNESGAMGVRPSVVMRRIFQLFPRMNLRDYDECEDDSLLVGGTIDLNHAALRQNSRLNSSLWQDVWHWYEHSGQYRALTQQIREGRDYSPLKGRIEPKLLNRLYDKSLSSSASRLESFHRCPFSYFSAYSLHLQERPRYQVTAADRGNLLHQALAYVGRKISQEELDWHAIGRAEAEIWADEALMQLLPDFVAGIMVDSARGRYLASRVKRVLVKTILLLVEHVEQGSFVPIAWELPFGFRENGAIPALEIPLPGGKKLFLRGYIDRLDCARDDQGRNFLRVIDYKTGNKDIDIADIFSGMSLQLMVYLLAALSGVQYLGMGQAQGAGMYYSLVQDSLVSVPMEEKQVKRIPDLRYEGITVMDEAAVSLADHAMSGYSRLIPLAKGKEGYYNTGKCLSKEELAKLCNHTLKLLSTRAEEMISGIFDVSPLRFNRGVKACNNCPYLAFCGFDAELAKERRAESFTKDEVLAKLAEEEEDG